MAEVLTSPRNAWPRRVLMTLPYANLAGTEGHVRLLARGLRELGVETRILMPDGPAVEVFRADDLDIRVMPTPSLGAMPAWLKALREEAARGVDLIHVHAAMEMVWAARLAAKAIPRVFTAHGYHVEADYMKAGLMLNRTAKAVISVSEPEQARLLRYGLKADLAKVVLNGIDLEPLRQARGMLKQELDLPESSRLIGMVNRLDAYKGVDVMLEALPRVLERHPACFLVIAGDGPERPRLEALSVQLGVTHAVRWLGRRQDLGNLLGSFDLFVTPTRKEAGPLAPLEAMACGLPVIATDLPALRALVRPGQDGELIAEDASPERWADVISDLLGDSARMEAYSASAEARAQRFSYQNMAQATLDVYEGVQSELSSSPKR